MKKLSNTEAELKKQKNVAYKKKCVTRVECILSHANIVMRANITIKKCS